MIYLDTSALIKLYIRERGSEDVQAWVAGQDDPLPVWDLHEMELVNALYLKVFWKDMVLREAEKQIELFRDRQRQGFYVSPELERLLWVETFFQICRKTTEIGTRTLDIQHVACALLLKPNSFISYDDRQRKLAKRAGMKVLPDRL